MVAKLQSHLELLRSQHRKLQARNAELERAQALAAAGSVVAGGTVVAGLSALLGELFDKQLYSDIRILIDGKPMQAHRLVLAAHGRWTEAASLADVQEIVLEGLSYPVGWAVFRWLYTDKVSCPNYSRWTFVVPAMHAERVLYPQCTLAGRVWCRDHATSTTACYSAEEQSH